MKHLFCVTMSSSPSSCPRGQREQNIGVWNGERFAAATLQGECSGSCSKDPNSLMGVREAFFKARWGKGSHKVGDQLVCKSLIGWWWGKRAVSQGLALSILRRQWVWGICAQGHLVVNFFHLVGSFSICKTTQEMYIRFCYLAYFRDELKILWLPCGWFTVSFLTGSYGSTVIFVWREGSVLGMPLRFYSVTILYIYESTNDSKDAHRSMVPEVWGAEGATCHVSTKLSRKEMIVVIIWIFTLFKKDLSIWLCWS